MACEGCRYPSHEQYKRYPGHWYCLRTDNGREICKTPTEEWNDFAANNKRLKDAATPKWCPELESAAQAGEGGQ